MTQAVQVKIGRKYEQVLKGALEIFVRDGYDGASVDDIARAASVSKATLYSYFPDKRILFAKVSEVECKRQAEVALAEIDFSQSPDIVLTEAAHRMVAFVTSDFGIATFRMCMSESPRFPEIGQMFYESGPLLVQEALKAYLSEATARGELIIEDLDLAADQFLELNKTTIFPRILCGVQSCFSEEERSRIAVASVEMFLARYAA